MSRAPDDAAQALITRKEELAREITAMLYAERPELMERYGERGREKCLQDMRYNLEHLAPAVALGEPLLFSRYVEWLRDMLGARGIPTDEVRRTLELTAEIARDRLGEAQATLIADVVQAGMEALTGPAPA